MQLTPKQKAMLKALISPTLFSAFVLAGAAVGIYFLGDQAGAGLLILATAGTFGAIYLFIEEFIQARKDHS